MLAGGLRRDSRAKLYLINHIISILPVRTALDALATITATTTAAAATNTVLM